MKRKLICDMSLENTGMVHGIVHISFMFLLQNNNNNNDVVLFLKSPFTFQLFSQEGR